MYIYFIVSFVGTKSSNVYLTNRDSITRNSGDPDFKIWCESDHYNNAKANRKELGVLPIKGMISRRFHLVRERELVRHWLCGTGQCRAHSGLAGN